MAETFVARREGSSSEVCLKRLRPALAADPVQRAHFADEARILARLCHPHVLALLDAGPDHLVTELVEGVDLRRMLAWLATRSERLPAPIALRIARDLADALAHAHAHGVVHRDVTPANVLLGRDGRVVLIDFGIARSDAQRQRTRTGLVKGKAAYMAPEQALGGTLDARTDLFALGVVLFEMLAGRRPHDGTSDVETIGNAMRGRRRAWGSHPPEREVASLVEALLSPDPADRPEGATSVVAALDALGPCDAGSLAAWARAAAAAPTRGGGGPETRPARRRERATETLPEHARATREEPALAATPSVHELETRELEAEGPTTVDAVMTVSSGEVTELTPRVALDPPEPRRTAWARALVALGAGIVAGTATGVLAALLLRALP
jgi:hypothetical protein